MFEDLDDGRWVFNKSEDFEITLAMGAYLNVDIAYRDAGMGREQDAETLNTRLSSLAQERCCPGFRAGSSCSVSLPDSLSDGRGTTSGRSLALGANTPK